MISVYTGIRPGAGTKSNVSFILGGEDGDSGIRLMSDGSTTVSNMLKNERNHMVRNSM